MIGFLIFVIVDHSANRSPAYASATTKDQHPNPTPSKLKPTSLILHLLDIRSSYTSPQTSTPTPSQTAHELTSESLLTPSNHNSANLTALIRLEERIVQVHKEGGAQGVQRLWSVEGQENNAGLRPGDQDVFVRPC